MAGGEPLLACLIDVEHQPNLLPYAIVHQTSGDSQTTAAPVSVTSGLATISIPTAAFAPDELIAVEVVEMVTTSPQPRLIMVSYRPGSPPQTNERPPLDEERTTCDDTMSRSNPAPVRDLDRAPTAWARSDTTRAARSGRQGRGCAI